MTNQIYALKLALEAITTYLSESPDPSEKAVEGLCDAASAARKALAAPVQPLPFGVSGGLVAIKTLLSRDPCVHANTAIGMIDAILKGQPAPVQEFVCSTGLCHYKPAAQPAPEQYTALEQALTRLQKRYGELEAKVAAQRPWVGLSDIEVSCLWLNTSPYFNENDFARAIEAKLKELNT